MRRPNCPLFAVSEPITCLCAPAYWQSVDFVADLHLQQDDATWQGFARYLQHTPADAVFLLGDILELWAGDDALQHPDHDFERLLTQTLRAVSQHKALYFMPGNRDFLIGAAFCAAAGLTPLEGPGLASQPTLSRFTALMATPANLKVLREAVLEMAGRGIKAERKDRRLRSVTLDVDSAPIEVHGHQPRAEWNGHYNARIYHPLITSIAETGDMLDARLRAGNVGTADGALDVILDVVDRARKSFCDVAMVRIDAGFPSAGLLAGLEARGIDYVSRLRANPVLDRLAEPHMVRPVGRRPVQPRTWLRELRYKADSWDKPRRVILVVKEREGDLLLDRFFLVTSLPWTEKLCHEVLAHYRERGKAEGHMGELKDVLAPALSSTNRAKSHLRGKAPKSRTPAIDAFACNEVRLLIACLAYQAMHIARRAMEKATGTGWSLRRLRERVLRAGARLVVSARRMTLTLSSAAAPFWAVLWPRLMALQWADP